MTGSPFAPSSDSPVRRAEFTTTDPDEAQAFIDRMYTARVGRSAAFDRTSPVKLSQVSAGEISSVDFTAPPDLTLRLDGTGDLSVSTLLSGTTQTEWGKDLGRYREGQVFLGTFPNADYLVRCHRLRIGILTVSAAAVARVTASLPDRAAEPLRFASMTPVSTGAAERWKRVSTFTRRLLDDEQTAASPLILDSAARLLAATALEVFPHNLLGEPGSTGTVAATPDTLRRAEEFVHQHAQAGIDVADVANACGVTPRALQYAFARHHDMSPMQYLRRVRLTRAHRDLLDADPAGGLTVTAIAARWGFAHPGRFAAAYRRTYGRSPSTTLRT